MTHCDGRHVRVPPGAPWSGLASRLIISPFVTRFDHLSLLSLRTYPSLPAGYGVFGARVSAVRLGTGFITLGLLIPAAFTLLLSLRGMRSLRRTNSITSLKMIGIIYVPRRVVFV